MFGCAFCASLSAVLLILPFATGSFQCRTGDSDTVTCAQEMCITAISEWRPTEFGCDVSNKCGGEAGKYWIDEVIYVCCGTANCNEDAEWSGAKERVKRQKGVSSTTMKSSAARRLLGAELLCLANAALSAAAAFL